MSLRERPVSVDDVAAIADLLTAIEDAEPADDVWSTDEILDEVAGVDIDLANGSLAIVDDAVDGAEGGRLVGFGVLDVGPATDIWRAYLFGGVHPQYWGRGVGSRIHQVLYRQAVAKRDAEHPDLSGELKVWALAGRRGAAALAAKHGYDVWRYFFRMRRDLQVPIGDGPAPAGFVIRPYGPQDAEPVRIARNLSFADHWGSAPQDPVRWEQQMVGAPSFRPQFSFVATRPGPDGPRPDDEVVGFVLGEEYDVETEKHGYRTGYVPLVGTVAAARGHGLAAALLDRSLAAMAADGCRYADLTVDVDSPTGAGRLYERAGFTAVERHEVHGRRF